ncbi:MAG: hypothetical protein NTZ05_15285, partial [Chloroflexi bacterium]|nr:hypothetical protein [Chloroflexota bacterium]
MVSRRIILIIASLLPTLVPSRVFAHGFDERYDLPAPLEWYLHGAAAAVVLSFVLFGVFLRPEQATDRYPRWNLFQIGGVRALLTNRWLLSAVRLASAALFLLVILSGFLGVPGTAFNFAPTFVWVIWWIGLGYFIALVGNIWPLINPWSILFTWGDRMARQTGLADSLEAQEPYPPRWGVWPALLLYFAFVWIEVIYEGSTSPASLAAFTVLYSVITWIGMAVYGKEVWLRHGEIFSVFFALTAKFAPTEVRVTDPEVCRGCSAPCRDLGDACINCYECVGWAEPGSRELNLRPWAVGLLVPEAVGPDRLELVMFMLASLTFDGLLATPVWVAIATWAFPVTHALGVAGPPALDTVGLLAVSAAFVAVYFATAALMRPSGEDAPSVRVTAAAFVYALVPIALAYQIAHYFASLLIQGQSIIRLISDPFGWNWNLLGTAGYQVNGKIVTAGIVWYSQIGLVIVGHVLSVYLAHAVALRRLRDPKR